VNIDCTAAERLSWDNLGWDDTNTLCLDQARVRILVVNDDMRSADTLRHILAQLGYSETLVAYSGKRAVSAVANYSPSVAIVDLHIADMTGYRLAGLLKGHALRQVRSIPLIAVADEASPVIVALARAAGFAAVVAKPVCPSILRGALTRNLP
jgi:PleD family two-component response regulator